jgi:hypothetical protein
MDIRRKDRFALLNGQTAQALPYLVDRERRTGHRVSLENVSFESQNVVLEQHELRAVAVRY